MSYKSDAQRKKFHVLEKEGKISPATVHEFDEASKGNKGKKLPKTTKTVKKSKTIKEY